MPAAARREPPGCAAPRPRGRRPARPSAPACSSGRSRWQRSLANGQRGWKAQPVRRVERVRAPRPPPACARRPVMSRSGIASQQHAACRGAAAASNSASRRRQLDEPPEIHHADAVGDVRDHREVVGDEEVGEAELALQVLHQVQDLRLHRDVERRGRLVADQEIRIARQARARSRCAGAGRRRIRAGTSRRRPARGPPAAAARPRASGSRVASLMQAVRADRLGDDVGHAPARVEAGVGVLEDHLEAPAHGASSARGAARRGRCRRTRSCRAWAGRGRRPAARRWTCRSRTRPPATASRRAGSRRRRRRPPSGSAAARRSSTRLSQRRETSK